MSPVPFSDEVGTQRAPRPDAAPPRRCPAQEPAPQRSAGVCGCAWHERSEKGAERLLTAGAADGRLRLAQGSGRIGAACAGVCERMRAPPRRCRDATAQRPPSLKTARALARCLRGELPVNRRSRSSSPRPAGSVTARSGAHSHKTRQSSASHSPLYCINCLCINCMSLTGLSLSLMGFPLLYKKPVPYGLFLRRLRATSFVTRLDSWRL
jgi:hypothetical protein